MGKPMEIDGVGKPEQNPNPGGVPEQNPNPSSNGGSEDYVVLIAKEEGEVVDEDGMVKLGSLSFENLGDGWIRCMETGHELRAEDKDTYVYSKGSRRYLIDAAVAQKKIPFCMFQPHPLFRSKLICKLTGDTINKSVEHIWRHFIGKRFKNKLGNYSLARKSVAHTDDSEKPDFWTPPMGNPWDFDDGSDIGESSASSDCETDDDIISARRRIAEKEAYLDSQIQQFENFESYFHHLEARVDQLMVHSIGAPVIFTQHTQHTMLKSQNPADQPTEATTVQAAVCSSSASQVECRTTIQEVACQLLNWKRELVASGRAIIEEDPVVVQVAHGLGGDDVKVLLDVIFVLDTPLTLTESSNFGNTLRDVGIGGYTLWPKSFLRAV